MARTAARSAEVTAVALEAEPNRGFVSRFRHRPSRGALVAVAVFLAIRIAYWLTGGGLSTAAIGTSWQLIDAHQLAAHPLQSLTVLHIQPPLFNLFVGVVLRWSPLPAALSFQILYTVCGLGIVIALRVLLLEFGFAPLAATIGTTAVAANPILLGYENIVTYEYPVAFLLLLSVLACLRYAERRSLRNLLGFVSLLTAIALTRALLHPMWLVASITFVVIAARPRAQWPQVIAVLAIPVVLVGAVVVKNQVRFDEPTMSSWLGMNLGRGVIASLPRHDVDALIRSGDLSPAARIAPFSGYEAYAARFGPCRTHFREPALRAATRPNGISNFNAACYLPVYRDAQTNALHAISARPGAYLARRWPSFAQHFSLPPVDNIAPGIEPFRQNPVLQKLGRAYEAALVIIPITVDDRDWAVPVFSRGTRYHVNVSLILLLGTMLVVGRALASLVAILRRGGSPRHVAWVYTGMTVGFVAFVSIATEYGENQRFRLLVDPLIIGILVAQVVTLLQSFGHRKNVAA